MAAMSASCTVLPPSKMPVENYVRLWHKLNDVLPRSTDEHFATPFGTVEIVEDDMIRSQVIETYTEMYRLRYAHTTGRYIKPLHTSECICDTSACTLSKCSKSACCIETGICHVVSMYCQSDNISNDIIANLYDDHIRLDMQALSINPHLKINTITSLYYLPWIPKLVSARDDIEFKHLTNCPSRIFDVNTICMNERLPFSLIEQLGTLPHFKSRLNMIAVAMRCDVTSDDVDNHSTLPWVKSFIDRRTMRHIGMNKFGNFVKTCHYSLGCEAVGFILPSGNDLFAPTEADSIPDVRRFVAHDYSVCETTLLPISWDGYQDDHATLRQLSCPDSWIPQKKF